MTIKMWSKMASLAYLGEGNDSTLSCAISSVRWNTQTIHLVIFIGSGSKFSIPLNICQGALTGTRPVSRNTIYSGR